MISPALQTRCETLRQPIIDLAMVASGFILRAVAGGRVVSSAIAEVEVRKVGFERLVEVFAQQASFFYGLLAVALSIGMGWIAGRLFALI